MESSQPDRFKALALGVANAGAAGGVGVALAAGTGGRRSVRLDFIQNKQ